VLIPKARYYAWEAFYGHQIATLRGKEVATIRRVAVARSLMIAIVTFIPVLAAILSFVTYSLSGHRLDVATVFASLQLFNVVRMPLAFFPFVFSSCADALVAMQRIGKFLSAEEAPRGYEIDQAAEDALRVDADFAWEVTAKAAGDKFAGAGGRGGRGGARGGRGGGRGAKSDGGRGGFFSRKKKDAPKTTSEEDKEKDKEKEKEDPPFAMSNVRLQVPRGGFVAVVGKIGSGKSSLLQGLIGEMRRTRGEVVFGGSVAYVPQSAWIMNATLRYVAYQFSYKKKAQIRFF
jgi:ATP-binding cassette, subfamily C (CFTR/MRP), member 1